MLLTTVDLRIAHLHPIAICTVLHVEFPSYSLQTPPARLAPPALITERLAPRDMLPSAHVAVETASAVSSWLLAQDVVHKLLLLDGQLPLHMTHPFRGPILLHIHAHSVPFLFWMAVIASHAGRTFDAVNSSHLQMLLHDMGAGARTWTPRGPATKSEMSPAEGERDWEPQLS